MYTKAGVPIVKTLPAAGTVAEGLGGPSFPSLSRGQAPGSVCSVVFSTVPAFSKCHIKLSV